MTLTTVQTTRIAAVHMALSVGVAVLGLFIHAV